MLHLQSCSNNIVTERQPEPAKYLKNKFPKSILHALESWFKYSHILTLEYISFEYLALSTMHVLSSWNNFVVIRLYTSFQLNDRPSIHTVNLNYYTSENFLKKDWNETSKCVILLSVSALNNDLVFFLFCPRSIIDSPVAAYFTIPTSIKYGF